METIVIALGGNALEDNSSPTADNQLKVVKQACYYIADLIEEGYKIILTHGNGPQIGRILIQNELSTQTTPAMPIDVCSAMSQGMIGYHIQQGLFIELLKRNINKPVVSVITQVLVDKNDLAFNNPTKPIGPFYTRDEAYTLHKEKNYIMKQDSNRGFRRVVASPKPISIIELKSIKTLLENNNIVICCGGGGIPVIKNNHGNLEGIAAVIDKDWSSSKLAQEIHADKLIILTAVDNVSLNFGKTNQKNLSSLSVEEAEFYIKEGHFAVGSMLPKIEAGVSFAKSNSNRITIITSLSEVKNCLNGKVGTVIHH